MRTLRLSGVGMVILALSCGLSIVTVDQSEDEQALDPMRSSHFTGTWTEDISDSGELIFTPRPGYVETLDNESFAIMEASDPRISGTRTQVLNGRAFPVDEQAGIFAPVYSGVVRIENEDGAWAGTLDGYINGADKGREWNRLEGEGAYEGLTAVFRWIEEGDAYEGVIIPGVPPNHPAPIAAGVDVAAE